jgi:hypothetical protein
MPHPFTTVPTLLKYISKVCSWPLRFYYTSGRLDPYLMLDVPSSGDPADYYYPSQEATCYLNAYNLSPFDFTIDRIKVEVVLDSGVVFSCTNTIPFLIKGASHQRIFMRSQCPMTPESAQHSKTSKQARVNIDAHIITSIRSFRIGRHIEQIKNVRVVGMV